MIAPGAFRHRISSLTRDALLAIWSSGSLSWTSGRRTASRIGPVFSTNGGNVAFDFCCIEQSRSRLHQLHTSLPAISIIPTLRLYWLSAYYQHLILLLSNIVESLLVTCYLMMVYEHAA